MPIQHLDHPASVASETILTGCILLMLANRLKVDDIVVEDSGVYSCDGFNRFGRETTNGTITVKPGECIYSLISTSMSEYR